MHTVLVMPKKTSDKLQEYYSALKDVFEREDIVICNWVESGTNIETALPELYDLVKGIHEWRAVIVSYDEDVLGRLDKKNPFDYNEITEPGWQDKSLSELQENKLILLSHLLGGVPLPNKEYELIYDKDDSKDDSIETRFKYVHKNEKKYEKLSKQFEEWNNTHKMKGFAPSEIIFVKTRNIVQHKDFDKVRQAWHPHMESDSSEFWLRNLYPLNSKFLVYDIEKKGILYEERDAFKFWLALLTLASSKIDSDVLQPQRLYSLNIDMNMKELRDVFQDKVKKLNLLKDKLVKSLKPGNEFDDTTSVIPKYKLEVPVNFTYSTNISKDEAPFKIKIDGGFSTDEGCRWEKHTGETYQKVRTLLKEVDRELEQSALGFRSTCEYEESEVEVLNQYAEEDFRSNIHDTYEQFLNSQKALPQGLVNYRDEMKQADKKVQIDISERMSKKQIFITLLGCTLLFLACIVPAFFQASSQYETLLVLGGSGVVLLLVGLLTLLYQKKKFTEDVYDFRDNFNNMLNDLSENAKLYKQFLSDVASHIHGASYAKHLDRKKADILEAAGIKKKYVSFIDEYKNKMALWSSALRLSINMNVLDDFLSPTYITEEDCEGIYSICEKDVSRQIPLNHSGYSVVTPFLFVECLRIDREEVYDDIR